MGYKDRVKELKERLRRERLDGLLVSKRKNIFYLCGLEAEDSSLIITSSGRDFVITDPRFKEEAEKDLSGFDINLIDGCRYAVVNNIIKKERIKKLGFESEWLSYNDSVIFKKRIKKAKLIPKSCLVENLRIIKDAQELGLIKRSCEITKEAYLYAKDRIKPRHSGRDLAVLIDNFMRRKGSSRTAFRTIVAQNPYSSRPHAPSTKRPFGRRSAVLVDMGAVFKGYNSDLTRVIFLGRITSKFKHIYNILKTAQERAFKKARPGVSFSELDRSARGYISNKGLGKYFVHSLGHGIGLEIHEPPKISKKIKGRLKPGMVFTIEPGIYIPGWGGLRLEDTVAVTEGGCEVLTDDIPK